ncbi:MAG: DUF4129 domain-containing protein [Pirellulales bacterium]
MAKRLHMTSADYVAIAISPALIMALVGSLVFFLIEVLYEGEYQARLSYVFALFVFAAVLVARISIEDGRERGALFAVPLGIATFVVLSRFVEHDSAFSGLINIVLIVVVWWCADKLTWDCTLIDDDQDASGEGLLQRVGIDESPGNPSPSRGITENELQAERDQQRPWWQRLFVPSKGPHTPGVWVVYFSLAALPLFGIGQLWIPASDAGRRQYAFSLLFVYVAAGLALLVTTSFLGLRRYLRQRHVEMPPPMAANWVTIGAVLIALVMFIALLIPRPAAEYAISQPPWKFHSPSDLSPSRNAVGNDGTQEQEGAANLVPGEEEAEQTVESEQGQSPGESGEQGSESKQGDETQGESSQQGQESESESEGAAGEASEATKTGQESHSPEDEQQENRDDSAASNSSATPPEQTEPPEENSGSSATQPSNSPRPFRLPELSFSLGGLSGIVKLVLYVLGGLLIAYFAWKHRHALLQGFRDLIQQLRELFARLFGGQPTSAAVAEDTPAAPPRKRFTDFRDPFASGMHKRLPPEELVRYTFEAFEAWAGDRGAPRTPDRTPTELLHAALPPQTPMFTAARRMVRLYSEVAYASGEVERSAAEELSELWRMMGEGTFREPANV